MTGVQTCALPISGDKLVKKLIYLVLKLKIALALILILFIIKDSLVL